MFRRLQAKYLSFPKLSETERERERNLAAIESVIIIYLKHFELRFISNGRIFSNELCNFTEAALHWTPLLIEPHTDK